MTRARIISIENPVVRADINPECTHYQHSKWVKRRKYVEDVLFPKMARRFPTEIFPAVTQEHFTIESGSVVYGDVRLKLGEGITGNLLSHVILWKWCVEHNELLLILEDDALLPEQEITVMQAIREFESYKFPAVLHLLSAIPSSEFGRKSFHDYTVMDGLLKLNHAGDLSGTAAYCINPQGAAALVSAAELHPTMPTDGFIHRAFERGEIDVLVPMNYQNCFLLHEHFADWNHVHNA